VRLTYVTAYLYFHIEFCSYSDTHSETASNTSVSLFVILSAHKPSHVGLKILWL